MEFAAGLVIGFLIGMLSWLALAVWLEARRAWAEGLEAITARLQPRRWIACTNIRDVANRKNYREGRKNF